MDQTTPDACDMEPIALYKELESLHKQNEKLRLQHDITMLEMKLGEQLVSSSPPQVLMLKHDRIKTVA